ncbi:hypothetical protein [Methanosphaerula subterraneus]|uniref:hypothetical protein n=1 Tax=Methanosphaerula subterraneus TaxID=3350244 RepID=UPI003F843F9C
MRNDEKGYGFLLGILMGVLGNFMATSFFNLFGDTSIIGNAFILLISIFGFFWVFRRLTAETRW